MNEIIKVVQLPQIKENLLALHEPNKAKVAEVMSMVCTVDTVKDIKKARTEIRQMAEAMENERKAVKAELDKPYQSMMDTYKVVFEDLRSADGQLKDQINLVETTVKKGREEKLRAFFDEQMAATTIDWLTFERIGLNITLSASEKSLKDAVVTFVDRVVSDCAAIQGMDDTGELMAEYASSLDLAKAMKIIKDKQEKAERFRQAQEQAKAQAEREAQVVEEVKKVETLSAPVTVVEEAPPQTAERKVTATFKVTATKSQLLELKKYLDEKGYIYE